VIAGLLPEKGGAADASQELTGWKHQSSEEGWNQPSQVEVHGVEEGIRGDEEGMALMPFKSKAQQRFMFATMPKTAKKWAKKTKSIKRLPARAKKKGGRK
jgi:hypothetical protein